MVLDSSDARDYHLVARALKVNQPADMNLFVIKAIEFVNVTQPKNGTEMRITFRRKIMSEMMTTFFPSLLLRRKLKKDLRFFLALSSPDAPKSRVEDDVTEAESDSCSLLSAALVGWTFTPGGVVFKLA